MGSFEPACGVFPGLLEGEDGFGLAGGIVEAGGEEVEVFGMF